MAQLELLADRAAESCPEQSRLLTHRLYLGLASFTAAYLQHQEFEEFEVMVMLSQHVSPEELLALDNAIVASISPEMMATVAGDHAAGDEHRGPDRAVRRVHAPARRPRCSRGC